jgi:hypothetical protein
MSTRLRWRQAGCIYLWCYHENTKNFPGWHMTADASGCESLLALVEEMESAQWSCEQTIHTPRPTPPIIEVPTRARRWSAAVSLHLKVRRAANFEQGWQLRCQEGAVTLTVGPARLAELKKGFLDIAQGLGDYSIPNDAPDDQRLWFWWHLE